MSEKNDFDIDKIMKSVFEEDVEIPDIVNLKSEEAYSMIRELEKDKKKKISKKPLKAVASVAIISALTITTTFAAGYIIDYFNNNKDSLYLSDKNDFEKTGTSLNLTMKNKGIELTIDDISIDDNYMVIFHTVKTNKNIKKISSDYEDVRFADPIIDVYVNDGQILESNGIIEREATYVSDNELKGMRKIDISNVDLDKNGDITLCAKDIFGVEGNWETKVSVNELKNIKEGYTYNIDKDYTITKDYTIINKYNKDGKNVKVKHNINIEKISVSPLASKIFINEKPSASSDEWIPTLGENFALFDENNKSLDIVDKGGFGPSSEDEIDKETHEFLKASKNIKSLTLVPISYNVNTADNNVLESQSIDKLPLVFEVSKYGKIIVEDIKITDKEIRYTYYKDGVVPNCPTLEFYDDDGKEVAVFSLMKESVDRHTGRYTTRLKLEGYKNDISKIKSINKISTYSRSNMKLLYDQKIEIDLKK